MTLTVRHALRNQTYTRQEGGLVRVEDHETGRVGIFRFDGRWVSGDLRSAELHLLDWVGGPLAASGAVAGASNNANAEAGAGDRAEPRSP